MKIVYFTKFFEKLKFPIEGKLYKIQCEESLENGVCI